MSARDDEVWRAAMRDVVPLTKRAQAPVGFPRISRHPRPDAPSYHLDAHGMTVQEAHAETGALLAAALRDERRTVVVVTGRSGLIRSEFRCWMEARAGVRRVEELNGGGAYRLHLAKPSKPR